MVDGQTGSLAGSDDTIVVGKRSLSMSEDGAPGLSG
jgi:hypothetical protein